MSDTAKPQQALTQEQRQEIVNKMFAAIIIDLGQLAKYLTSNPVNGGFLLDSEAVGIAQLRLGRAKAGLERMLQANGGQSPQAADGALIGGFAPAPASQPEGKSLDAVFAGGQNVSLVGTAVLGAVGAAVEGCKPTGCGSL